MEVLYLLVPMSVVLALLVVALFAWALNDGQFDADDLEGEGLRILLDDAGSARLDARQGAAARGPEESRRLSQGPA